MALLEKKKDRDNDDTKVITAVIITVILLFWIFIIPGNKIVQICSWGNDINYMFAKIFNQSPPEYIHLRNKAVYMAKMYPKHPKRSLYYMDKALAAIPADKESELRSLYAERANLKLYYKDQKGALNDFILAKELGIDDNFKAGLLLADTGHYKLALSYCDKILAANYLAFSGYVCLSNLYEKAGRSNAAITFYDLAIDRKPGNARAYMERAKLKQRLGDSEGYDSDMAKAKELSPYIDTKESIIDDAIKPKKLSLVLR